MTQVAIAASSTVSAEAGAEVADLGGNAVDAALASTFAAIALEPGLVAVGGSGFLTISPPDGEPVVIDAYAEMPGRDTSERLGDGGVEVFLGYGGGMNTIIGYGSVATPGAVAGLGMAWERYGSVPWATVLEPTIERAERGYPVPAGSAEYLAHSGESVFGWHPESRAALVPTDGASLAAGAVLRSPELAESLRLLGRDGAQGFYTGELGHRMAEEVSGNGGLLTTTDLAAYRAVPRDPIRIELDEWEIITNPAPALGGAVLAAMLLLLDRGSFDTWNGGGAAEMARIQRAVLAYRAERLEARCDDDEVRALLDAARLGDHRRLLGSPSTIHVSTVDTDGLACSITMSAGYGSGVVIPGTGIWLNNSLGEVELHPEGFHGLAPGTRLTSNMAPTIARRGDGAVLAIGSPGASRITTAIAQAVVNFVHLGLSLQEAIDHPRLHVEAFGGEPTVAVEPGIALPPLDGLTHRSFATTSMYFGGVQAALWDPEAGLAEGADPRRAGGIARGGN